MTDLHASHRSPVGWPPPPAAGPPPPPAAAPRPSGPGGPGGVRTAVIAAAVSALVTTAIVVPLAMATAGGSGAETAAPPAAEQQAGDAAVSGEPGGAGDATTPTGSARGAMSIADVADAVAPSVARVDIAVAGAQGSGSAVVYRSDGYLLTNAHVVSGAGAVAVTLPEGTRLRADVVGVDEQTDLAVLRVDPSDVAGGELPAATFADSLPRIGETAVAIGSPFELDGSVTAGIVSGLGRSIPGTPLGDLIQTDAPINPGNSGGALVNDRSEVIGINTAILPASPTARGNIGIGFAIPVTTALPLADQLIEQGYVQHALLGVQGQDVDPRVAELYRLPVSAGALIVDVGEGTGADEAGLVRGDIVTAVDGEEVGSMAELAAHIRRRSPGDELTLTVVSGSAEREVDVVLGAADPPGRGR